MSGPDPSTPRPTATGALRVQPDDASFETDFADLAARFAAKSGGGLSPELSAELALEIVLNEIVEQACLGTGATGAAIVLPRDGKMVCRASNGLTAPKLGAELDAASGLSGECIKTRRTQRCDDVLVDPRADIEASRRLGVRSVMVMPIQRGTELLGVFELFSSQAFAFGDRDEATLEALADRILSNLDRAAHPPSPEIENTPASESISEHSQEEEIISETADPIVQNGFFQRRYDFATWALSAVVLACAVLLAVGTGRHLGMPAATPRTQRVASPPTTSVVETRASTSSPAANASAPQATVKPKSNNGVPPGGLRVYENGKEVFRVPSGASQSEAAEPGMQRAATVEPENVVKVSPATAEGSLLHRVEPEYPEDARQQRVQGQVVLDVHIGVDGAVQDVQVLSWPAQLAAASIEAVKQWKFKPRVVDNRPAAMQTRITMNFRLPQ